MKNADIANEFIRQGWTVIPVEGKLRRTDVKSFLNSPGRMGVVDTDQVSNGAERRLPERGSGRRTFLLKPEEIPRELRHYGPGWCRLDSANNGKLLLFAAANGIPLKFFRSGQGFVVPANMRADLLAAGAEPT